MKVYDKGIIVGSLNPIDFYPTVDGEYWVIRYNEQTEEIESIDKLEWVHIDEDYESMYDGWQDIQYEVEHPREGITYYWTEDLKLT